MQPHNSTHPRIPPHAECVFSGIRTDVYQWDQRMYDGSVNRFERLRFLDAAFCICILPTGRIVVQRQEQPGREMFFSLPGGSFDIPYEDPLECAQRELLEETGYVSTDWKYWMQYDGNANVATNVYYYIARAVEKTVSVNPDPGEKIELFDVSFDEFLLLSSDKRFHHHWNLLPILYEARLSVEKKEELRNIFYS